MTDRAEALEDFLLHAGWADAQRTPLAGDASRRSYLRLERDGARRIVMDAPASAGQDVRPFLAIGATLAARGLSVPRVEARDEAEGFLLLEDLGDDTYTRLLRRAPAEEPALYAAAAGALARLQADPPPADLSSYPASMPELAALSIDWYAPGGDRAALVSAMAAALDHPAVAEPVLVHRDFHADNLIWLPGREGAARVGMLDFQDAMKGPREYDLASLIHDPRRPVSEAARRAALTVWGEATARDAETVAAGVAICSAQRCLRILGVFARLCLRDGKPRYVDFIPATWTALQSDLRHPALAGLRAACAALPAPEAARLDMLRAGAGTRTEAAEPVA
jgi:aminoglycoside/choline kinase family phosphotransferase